MRALATLVALLALAGIASEARATTIDYPPATAGDLSDGTNCAAGQAAQGVDENLDAQGCFTPAGSGNMLQAQGYDQDGDDVIDLTEHAAGYRLTDAQDSEFDLLILGCAEEVELGSCSTATTQECLSDKECPGTETCDNTNDLIEDCRVHFYEFQNTVLTGGWIEATCDLDIDNPDVGTDTCDPERVWFHGYVDNSGTHCSDTSNHCDEQRAFEANAATIVKLMDDHTDGFENQIVFSQPARLFEFDAGVDGSGGGYWPKFTYPWTWDLNGMRWTITSGDADLTSGSTAGSTMRSYASCTAVECDGAEGDGCTSSGAEENQWQFTCTGADFVADAVNVGAYVRVDGSGEATDPEDANDGMGYVVEVPGANSSGEPLTILEVAIVDPGASFDGTPCSGGCTIHVSRAQGLEFAVDNTAPKFGTVGFGVLECDENCIPLTSGSDSGDTTRDIPMAAITATHWLPNLTGLTIRGWRHPNDVRCAAIKGSAMEGGAIARPVQWDNVCVPHAADEDQDSNLDQARYMIHGGANDDGNFGIGPRYALFTAPDVWVSDRGQGLGGYEVLTENVGNADFLCSVEEGGTCFVGQTQNTQIVMRSREQDGANSATNADDICAGTADQCPARLRFESRPHTASYIRVDNLKEFYDVTLGQDVATFDRDQGEEDFYEFTGSLWENVDDFIVLTDVEGTPTDDDGPVFSSSGLVVCEESASGTCGIDLAGFARLADFSFYNLNDNLISHFFGWDDSSTREHLVLRINTSTGAAWWDLDGDGTDDALEPQFPSTEFQVEDSNNSGSFTAAGRVVVFDDDDDLNWKFSAGGGPNGEDVIRAALQANTVRNIELTATFSKCRTLYAPTENVNADDDIPSLWRAPADLDITEIWCETDASTATINLQNDDGTPADIASADIVCDTNGEVDAGLSATEDDLSDGETLDLDIASVGAADTIVRLSICWEYDFD